MKKRIIICCDGTWNEPDKNPTNVVKLVRAIAPVDRHGVHQVVFYDQGVGTHGLTDKYLGGGFGMGVKKNILDAYRFLVHNYTPGDEIFCFGFSRGAYTARALCGMLNATGLIEKSQLSQLSDVYKYYRTRPEKREAEKYQSNLRPEIKMIGVWDTVGALGAPTPILGRFTKRFISFFDTKLSPYIKNAYHALALDEQRGPFKPDLWTGSVKTGQTVEQVWFAGVHSDVGGGYREQGLSDIALTWMLTNAEELGLEFDQAMLKNAHFFKPDITTPIHNSYRTGYKLLEKLRVKKHVRNIEGDPKNPPINVSVHKSVDQKMSQDESYRPVNYDHAPVSSERRKFVRQPASASNAVVGINGEETACNIVDFNSLGGARIRSDLELGEQEVIHLSSDYFAKTVGSVAWKDGKEYGIRFAS